ncbi:hypothetical protein [Tenacibaculum sp. nBUS_03]|uniref:hypothetical protein n=1 Tax=Tenacibaculum sp. nBUS_03 TaxID=3395320 RepID=UPI003EBB2608
MKKNYFLLIFLLFISCSYNFSSDSFQDLEIPNTSENSINLINFNDLDIINIETRIDYLFEAAPNQYVIDSKVYLDGEEIGVDWQSNKGSFNLLPSRYVDGTHEIRVQLFFTSGSGSLKDQSGLEILEKNQIFKFIVKRNPAEPPKINEVKMENGSVRVKWSIPVNKNFKEAFLSLKYKYSEIRIPLSENELDSGTYLDTYTILFTGNSNKFQYDQYSQVDYSIVYSSEFNDSYGSKITLVDDPELFKFKIGYNNNVTYKIVWSEHPFYGNFTSFKYGDLVDFSSRGGEHIINEPYIIGKNYSSAIVIREDGRYLPYNYYEMELDENSFGLFNFNHLFSEGIIYNPSNQNYYAIVVENKSGFNYIYYIYEYSNDMNFIRKRELGLEPLTGYTGIYLDPISNNIYLDTYKNSYLIDKNNLEVIEKYSPINNLFDDQIFRNNILKIYNSSPRKLTLTDVSTGNIFFNSNNVLDSGYLSRDGKYIHIRTNVENAIYKIENNTLQKVYDLSPNFYYNDNIFFENDILYYVLLNEIFIVDLNTKNTKSFTFGTAHGDSIKIKVDTVGENILLTQNSFCGIYDMNTNQIKTFTYENNKSISGLFNSEDRDYYLNLYNNRLIHSKGIFINNF